MARQDPLANKVALVTASTDGIGFAIARRLAQDGAHVVVSSRKQHNVDRAVAALQGEGLSVTGTVCHVGKAEDRERLVATVIELSPWEPPGGSPPCFNHLLCAIHFVQSLHGLSLNLTTTQARQGLFSWFRNIWNILLRKLE